MTQDWPAATAMAALSALPLGVWVVGADNRLVLANAAATRAAGLEPGGLPPGMPFAELARTFAYRGVYGHGDPATLAADHLNIDRTRPARRRIRRTDGACFDLLSTPMPEGGFIAVLWDVTDLLAATEEAQAQARRLETLLSRLRGGVAAYDENRRIALINPAYEDLLGMPRGSVRPGTSYEEFFRTLARRGEFSNQDSEAVVNDRLRLDRTRPASYQRVRPNGQVLRFESQPLPEGGHLVEITDITVAKRAEDEAQRRAALLDGVLASMPHGVVVFGADGRVAMVNAAYQAIMAGSEVAIGEHRAEITRRRAAAGEYGPGDPAELVEWHMKAPALFIPVQRVRPNGTVLDIRYAPLPDGGTVQVVTDITALHAARAEATARAAVLQAMLDNMRHGIALYGPDRRLIACNRLALGLSGTPGEVIRVGVTLEESLAVQQRAGVFGTGPEAEAEVARIAAFDRSQPIRYQRTTEAGEVIEVQSDPTPDGGFVVSWTDITARARAEAAAEQRAAMLQVALESMRHGFMLFDSAARLVTANTLAASCCGLAEADLVPGRPLAELAERQRAEGMLGEGARAEARVRRLLAIDRRQPYAARQSLPDGRVMEVRSAPTPDGGFVLTLTDITPLAQAEAEAQRRAALLQTMQDSMQHGLALFGPDKRLVVANRLAASLAGLSEEGLHAGMPVAELVQRQLERGVFGEGPEAEAAARAVAQRDRSRSHPMRRHIRDGRVIDSVSDPTPDGGFVITWTDVTALVRAEAAAEQRAATLQAMIDNMHNGVALFGPDRSLAACNRLMAELAGLPGELVRPGAHFDTLTRAMQAAGSTGDPALEAQLSAEAIAADRSRPQHHVRPTRDGRMLEVFSDPMPDGGFVITMTDITPLARAEAEARERASILQVMLDSMRHGICYYGADRRLIAANALTATLGGYPPEALVKGISIDEVIDMQVAAGTIAGDVPKIAAMARALDRSRPARYIRPNADGRVVEVTSDPAPDGGFVITLSDISALARAEEEAQHRAGILQAMLDNIHHGIALFDEAGTILAVNPVFLSLLELPPESMAAGGSFAGFIDLLWARGEYGEGEAGLETATRLKARDRRQPHTSVRTRPNGTVIEIVSEPVPDGGWVLALTDVSEDRRIRAELERAKDAAEAANRAKSRFLATMSHELRTPLNAVIGFSEAITVDPDPVRGQEYVRSIHEAGRHLLTLIDDILDVTRAETTGFAITEGEVELAPLVEGTVRVMQATAASAGVALQAALPPALPLLRADELRLRQVLLNLISNAVKFTPQGGEVRVSAGLDEAGGLVLCVADSGIGIRPEDIPRTFEPFTQLDSSLARRFPGSGLGLYLSRALAEAQGGTLTLESAPGAGTTAVLRFPKSRLLTSVAA